MDITRFTPRNDNAVPFDSFEFDAGYLERLSSAEGRICIAEKDAGFYN